MGTESIPFDHSHFSNIDDFYWTIIKKKEEEEYTINEWKRAKQGTDENNFRTKKIVYAAVQIDSTRSMYKCTWNRTHLSARSIKTSSLIYGNILLFVKKTE